MLAVLWADWWAANLDLSLVDSSESQWGDWWVLNLGLQKGIQKAGLKAWSKVAMSVDLKVEHSVDCWG